MVNLIKEKSKETIIEFSNKIMELISNKDKRYTNIFSIETASAMSKISNDYKLVGKKVHLRTFYDGDEIVGGLYGMINGHEIYDLHSILFKADSIVAKRDLARAYKDISKKFTIISFNVVKGSQNEIFHDALLKRYAKKSVYQYKVDKGSYTNVLGEKSKLVYYKIKLIK